MKYTRGRVLRSVAQLIGLLLVLTSLSCSPAFEGPSLIDRSTINMVALNEGGHPWLSITLSKDPTDKDLCPMRWSPITRTLAYLDENMLCTWNPSNNVSLDAGKNWRGLYWSPNGQYLVVSCTQETLIVDAQTMSIKRTYDGQWIIWWCGDSIRAAKRMDASKRSKKDAQVVDFDGGSLALPAGLTLIAASPDGKALLAQTNSLDDPTGGTFVLLGLDSKGDSVIWIKPAPTKATKDFAYPDLLWNERFQMATETIDAGGGYDIHAFAEAGGQTLEVKFAAAANYSWVSGPLSWTGEELFVPMTLARVAQTSSKQSDVHFWNELALLDGKSHSIRSVSSGLPFETAAASADYLSMVVTTADGPRIIITPWLKDESGKIQGIKYAGEGSAAADAREVAEGQANTVGNGALDSSDKGHFKTAGPPRPNGH